MLRKALFFSIGFLASAVVTDAATKYKTPTKISDSSQAALTFEKVDDRIVNLRGMGRRCVEKNQICRFYYSGYYYETPWWTAPEII